MKCQPATPPARLTADGKLYRRYDPQAKPILASLPGARWDGGCWRVSLDEGHRHRVLKVADELGVTVAPALRLPPSPAAVRARDAGLYSFQV